MNPRSPATRDDAVRASEERYRAFVENSSEGIWRLEFDPPIDTSLPVDVQVAQAYERGRFAECNLAMAKLYGFDAVDDFIGQTLELMLPSSDPAARARLASVVEKGYRVVDVESVDRDVTGRVKHFASSMSGVVGDGRLHRIWGTQRDITQRKAAEAAQAFLAAVVSSSDDAIIAKDLNGVIQQANAAAERIFGYSVEELAGRSVRILIPPERQQEEDEILARIRRGERIEHFETKRVRKDGQLLDISLSISPVLDAAGRLIGISKIARDITAQKRAAAALAAEQAWFRTTLGSIGDAVVASDPEGTVTYLNATAAALTGWSEPEAAGRPLHEVFRIVDEKSREPVESPAAVVMRRGHVVGLANHTVLIARDGTERPIADSAAPIRDPEGRMLGVVLVFRDVSDERRAEEALAEQREWLETTLESIADAVIATDVQGQIVFMNPVAERLTGWRAAHARGRLCRDVLRLVNEQTRERMADPAARVLAVGGAEGFGRHTVLVSVDGTARPIDESVAPIRNRDGRITGAVLVFRDVSERRGLELDLQHAAEERERLLEAERAARAEAERASRVKDEFVATVSHELRTPLNAILGWTQLMMMGRHDPAIVERGLDVIARNTRLQAQLISDLLDVSRIVAGKLQLEAQPLNLHDIVKEVVETVRPEAASKGVTIQEHLDQGAGAITGDPARMQQVIWNLLSNAVKFTASGGLIDVMVRKRNEHAEFVVADTGVGIRRDVLPHVFDRFIQADRSITRRFGGLGLGLSIVKHLVELHGGSVAAESPGEGQGATFTISLPIGAAPSAPPPGTGDRDAPAQSAATLGAMRILVVEDEPDTREFLKRLLETHGAEVRTAASAADALAALGREVPDVLISDIGLADVDGYELVRRIREGGESQVRTVPAIALTAYARPEDRTRALGAGYQAHVSKPVEPAELLATIAALGGAAAGDTRDVERDAPGGARARRRPGTDSREV